MPKEVLPGGSERIANKVANELKVTAEEQATTLATKLLKLTGSEKHEAKDIVKVIKQLT